MRIEVTGKHLEITPAIRTYAEAKANKLPKLFDGTQLVRVVLEVEPKGGFKAEIEVDVKHHKAFISHASDADLYAAIDVATDKAQRQLRDYKDKLRT